MAEYSGFFNATAVLAQDPDTGQTVKKYDRVYDAEDFANYFSTFITDGVFAKPSNQLKVVAKEGLTVTVKSGKAYIKGYWYTLPEDMDLTFNPNSKGVAINNLVVCELSFTTRTITVHVEEDVSDTKRTENRLVLASFTLNPGISAITTAMITDRRPDKEYCGFVGQMLETIDYNELLEQNKAQFNEWFGEMKDQLSTDAAGSLQQQLDVLKEDTGNLGKMYKSGYENQQMIVKNDSYRLDYVRYGLFSHWCLVFNTESRTGSSRFRNARAWCIFITAGELFSDTLFPSDNENYELTYLVGGSTQYVSVPLYTTTVAGNNVREKFCTVNFAYRIEASVESDSNMENGKVVNYYIRVVDYKVMFEEGFNLVSTDYKGISFHGYVYGQNDQCYFKSDGYNPI